MSARIQIPPALAAKALFLSDRTCCVCRDKSKGVQIHHIDGNSSNNVLENLAVLCQPCHEDTMLKGGFCRKLDAEQVILYRDDWLRIVDSSRRRLDSLRGSSSESERDDWNMTLATGIAEIYREAGDYYGLALHYEAFGNAELRDKYIEKAIAAGVDDWELVILRNMQARRDLVPPEVAERQLKRLADSKDFTGLARFQQELGDDVAAAKAYAAGLADLAGRDNLFSLGFYFKEAAKSGIIDALFEAALGQAETDGDLWWQIRSLEELEWDSELRKLVLSREQEIRSGNDSLLKQVLARVLGDASALVEAVAQESHEERGLEPNARFDESID